MVEIRTNCKECGGDLPKRFRTYCSTKCRNKATNRKNRDYQKQWARNKRGEYDPGKIQCLICGKWYVQIGSHTVQAHKTLAREYKVEFDLPISKGVIPAWYKKMKGDQALENGTFKNLEAGADKRYKKGDPRASEITGWKGRKGNIGFLGYK